MPWTAALESNAGIITLEIDRESNGAIIDCLTPPVVERQFQCERR
jgi:hypothetical protein